MSSSWRQGQARKLAPGDVRTGATRRTRDHHVHHVRARARRDGRARPAASSAAYESWRASACSGSRPLARIALPERRVGEGAGRVGRAVAPVGAGGEQRDATRRVAAVGEHARRGERELLAATAARRPRRRDARSSSAGADVAVSCTVVSPPQTMQPRQPSRRALEQRGRDRLAAARRVAVESAARTVARRAARAHAPCASRRRARAGCCR